MHASPKSENGSTLDEKSIDRDQNPYIVGWSIFASIVLWVTMISVLGYAFWPRERRIGMQKPVYETKTKIITRQVEVNGQLIPVQIPVSYDVPSIVSGVTVQPPSRQDILRFIVLIVAAVLLGAYFFSVIVPSARNNWTGRSSPKSLELQRVGITTALSGAVFGFLAQPSPNEAPAPFIQPSVSSSDAQEPPLPADSFDEPTIPLPVPTPSPTPNSTFVPSPSMRRAGPHRVLGPNVEPFRATAPAEDEPLRPSDQEDTPLVPSNDGDLPKLKGTE